MLYKNNYKNEFFKLFSLFEMMLTVQKCIYLFLVPKYRLSLSFSSLKFCYNLQTKKVTNVVLCIKGKKFLA